MNAREMPYSRHERLELVVVADHPVDVVARGGGGRRRCPRRRAAGAAARRRSARPARARSGAAASIEPSLSLGPPHARRPHVRRHVAVAGDAARSAARRARPVPLRREGRRRSTSSIALDGESARLAELGLFELHPDGGVRGRRAARLRALAAELTRGARAARGQGRRHHERRRPGDVPALARRPPARERRRAEGRPRLFDDRRRVKTEAQLAGIRRAQKAAEAGDGRRARPAAREARTAAASTRRRRAAHGRAGEVGDEQASPRTARRADEFIVSPGAQGAVGHDMGSGPIEAGVPIVDRHLAPRQRVVRVLRHDAHVRRRRGPRRRRASGTACARRRSTARSPRSRRAPTAGDLRGHVRDLRGGRRADAAHEDAGRAAERRLLPRARPRRRARGARAAAARAVSEKRARRRRRRHGRAGPVPRRATAACASRT